MYNYNFISNSDGFISDNTKVRNVSNDYSMTEVKNPQPTYYANTSLFSRKCYGRRPTDIGKINEK